MSSSPPSENTKNSDDSPSPPSSDFFVYEEINRALAGLIRIFPEHETKGIKPVQKEFTSIVQKLTAQKEKISAKLDQTPASPSFLIRAAQLGGFPDTIREIHQKTKQFVEEQLGLSPLPITTTEITNLLQKKTEELTFADFTQLIAGLTKINASIQTIKESQDTDFKRKKQELISACQKNPKVLTLCPVSRRLLSDKLKLRPTDLDDINWETHIRSYENDLTFVLTTEEDRYSGWFLIETLHSCLKLGQQDFQNKKTQVRTFLFNNIRFFNSDQCSHSLAKKLKISEDKIKNTNWFQLIQTLKFDDPCSLGQLDGYIVVVALSESIDEYLLLQQTIPCLEKATQQFTELQKKPDSQLPAIIDWAEKANFSPVILAQLNQLLPIAIAWEKMIDYKKKLDDFSASLANTIPENLNKYFVQLQESHPQLVASTPDFSEIIPPNSSPSFQPIFTSIKEDINTENYDHLEKSLTSLLSLFQKITVWQEKTKKLRQNITSLDTAIQVFARYKRPEPPKKTLRRTPTELTTSSQTIETHPLQELPSKILAVLDQVIENNFFVLAEEWDLKKLAKPLLPIAKPILNLIEKSGLWIEFETIAQRTADSDNNPPQKINTGLRKLKEIITQITFFWAGIINYAPDTGNTQTEPVITCLCTPVAAKVIELQSPNQLSAVSLGSLNITDLTDDLTSILDHLEQYLPLLSLNPDLQKKLLADYEKIFELIEKKVEKAIDLLNTKNFKTVNLPQLLSLSLNLSSPWSSWLSKIEKAPSLQPRFLKFWGNIGELGGKALIKINYMCSVHNLSQISSSEIQNLIDKNENNQYSLLFIISPETLNYLSNSTCLPEIKVNYWKIVGKILNSFNDLCYKPPKLSAPLVARNTLSPSRFKRPYCKQIQDIAATLQLTPLPPVINNQETLSSALQIIRANWQLLTNFQERLAPILQKASLDHFSSWSNFDQITEFANKLLSSISEKDIKTLDTDQFQTSMQPIFKFLLETTEELDQEFIANDIIDIGITDLCALAQSFEPIPNIKKIFPKICKNTPEEEICAQFSEFHIKKIFNTLRSWQARSEIMSINQAQNFDLAFQNIYNSLRLFCQNLPTELANPLAAAFQAIKTIIDRDFDQIKIEELMAALIIIYKVLPEIKALQEESDPERSIPNAQKGDGSASLPENPKYSPRIVSPFPSQPSTGSPKFRAGKDDSIQANIPSSNDNILGFSREVLKENQAYHCLDDVFKEIIPCADFYAGRIEIKIQNLLQAIKVAIEDYQTSIDLLRQQKTPDENLIRQAEACLASRETCVNELTNFGFRNEIPASIRGCFASWFFRFFESMPQSGKLTLISLKSKNALVLDFPPPQLKKEVSFSIQYSSAEFELGKITPQQLQTLFENTQPYADNPASCPIPFLIPCQTTEHKPDLRQGGYKYVLIVQIPKTINGKPIQHLKINNQEFPPGTKFTIQIPQPETPDGDDPETIIQKFEIEQYCASLPQHSQNLTVQIYGRLGTRDRKVSDTVYNHAFLTEFIPGQTLNKYITKYKKTHSQPSLPLKTMEDITRYLAHIIGFLHRSGFANLDLKPSDIMIDFDETEKPLVRILDFAQFNRIFFTFFADPESVNGSPSYLDPLMRKQDTETYYHSTNDLYALGTILYELIAKDRFSVEIYHQAQTLQKSKQLNEYPDCIATLQKIAELETKLTKIDQESQKQTRNKSKLQSLQNDFAQVSTRITLLQHELEFPGRGDLSSYYPNLTDSPLLTAITDLCSFFYT